MNPLRSSSLVLWVGLPVVERELGTGESSDIQGDVAGLAFAALCISLSAPPLVNGDAPPFVDQIDSAL